MSKKSRRREITPLTKEEEKLVKGHMHIATFAARKAYYRTRGYTGCFEFEDLVSVAKYALCVAAKDFEPSRGFKFSTYATRKAEGYIQHALRDHSRMVKVPRFVFSYREDVRDLSLQGFCTQDISEKLGISEEKVVDCMNSWQEIHFSVDSPFHDEGEGGTWEIPSEDCSLSDSYLKSFIPEISRLSPGIVDMLLDYHNKARKLKEWEEEFCKTFFDLYRGKINSKIRN